jgi:hypothetical protein
MIPARVDREEDSVEETFQTFLLQNHSFSNQPPLLQNSPHSSALFRFFLLIFFSSHFSWREGSPTMNPRMRLHKQRVMDPNKISLPIIEINPSGI